LRPCFDNSRSDTDSMISRHWDDLAFAALIFHYFSFIIMRHLISFVSITVRYFHLPFALATLLVQFLASLSHHMLFARRTPGYHSWLRLFLSLRYFRRARGRDMSNTLPDSFTLILDAHWRASIFSTWGDYDKHYLIDAFIASGAAFTLDFSMSGASKHILRYFRQLATSFQI
jgi:hypothetical protein